MPSSGPEDTGGPRLGTRAAQALTHQEALRSTRCPCAGTQQWPGKAQVLMLIWTLPWFQICPSWSLWAICHMRPDPDS